MWKAGQQAQICIFDFSPRHFTEAVSLEPLKRDSHHQHGFVINDSKQRVV
jgi:hypothetical protein